MKEVRDFKCFLFLEMHDDWDEPVLGLIRGAEEEEVQEVPGPGRGGGRRERPLARLQPGQRAGERDGCGQKWEQPGCRGG